VHEGNRRGRSLDANDWLSRGHLPLASVCALAPRAVVLAHVSWASHAAITQLRSCHRNLKVLDVPLPQGPESVSCPSNAGRHGPCLRAPPSKRPLWHANSPQRDGRAQTRWQVFPTVASLIEGRHSPRWQASRQAAMPRIGNPGHRGVGRLTCCSNCVARACELCC